MKQLFIYLTFSCYCSFNVFGQSENSKIKIKDLGFNFIRIEKGEFIMGSNFHLFHADAENEKWYRDEAPMHRVKITKDFHMLETEVTRSQFELFVNSTGYKTTAEIGENELKSINTPYYGSEIDMTWEFYESNHGSLGVYNEHKGVWEISDTLNWRNPGYKYSNNHPITHVSWKDAIAFCNWLNSIDSTYIYSLPSEAEWEYAASFKGKNQYSWGNEHPNQNSGGNIADKSFLNSFPNWKYPTLSTYDDKYSTLSPVASFGANEFGLYDMTGNVWEWVHDDFENYTTTPVVDPLNDILIPTNPDTNYGKNLITGNNQQKVIRGGGFDWELDYLRTTKRRKISVSELFIDDTNLKYLSAINIGFRIKRTLRENKKKISVVEFVREKIMGNLQDINSLYKEAQISQQTNSTNVTNDSLILNGTDIYTYKVKELIQIQQTNLYWVFVEVRSTMYTPDGEELPRKDFEFFLVQKPQNEYSAIGLFDITYHKGLNPYDNIEIISKQDGELIQVISKDRHRVNTEGNTSINLNLNIKHEYKRLRFM